MQPFERNPSGGEVKSDSEKPKGVVSRRNFIVGTVGAVSGLGVSENVEARYPTKVRERTESEKFQDRISSCKSSVAFLKTLDDTKMKEIHDYYHSFGNSTAMGALKGGVVGGTFFGVMGELIAGFTAGERKETTAPLGAAGAIVGFGLGATVPKSSLPSSYMENVERLRIVDTFIRENDAVLTKEKVETKIEELESEVENLEERLEALHKAKAR